ncbi:unnamed protein product [Phytophthora fragariaefolia]|uniref:Unnamed protein product n=1 Tax=Phytophthora fragariaefolia TaxID=1490495 RepID=A0A9W7CTW8_9STRA|nr:unnamed protein product [Phytophthora fragariaefolia]
MAGVQCRSRSNPPAVDLEGKDSGPDSATPRASITPRPSDVGEEDEYDGDVGDGNNGGSNNKKKKKGKKKQNLLGLVTDGEQAARRLLCPYAMWQAIEGHFGTRDPTDYASSYTGVFRYRLEDAENPETFVQTLDSNIITFERVIDAKLSDIFKSMILQHALPTSWEYIVRGWLGQAKTLSYVKLMELVSSELKRRRPDGSGQDKGKWENAYAAVEDKPIGGIPLKKKQNTGTQYNKKDSKRHDHRDRDHKGHEYGRRDDQRSPPRGHTSGQWTSGHSGAHEDDRGRQGYCGYDDQRGPHVVTDHDRPIMAVSQEGTGMEDQHPIL